jgi:hypothetical protein
MIVDNKNLADCTFVDMLSGNLEEFDSLFSIKNWLSLNRNRFV